MINRIAHHVHEWVGQDVHKIAVNFYIFPFGGKLYRFSNLAGGIAYHPRQFLERRAQRNHPHAHAEFLQLAYNLAGMRDLPGEIRRLRPSEIVIAGNHRLGDNQLSHHVDEAVETVGAYANCGVCNALTTDGTLALCAGAVRDFAFTQ